MQLLVFMVLAFVAVAYSKPQFVEWFKINEAVETHKPAYTERKFKVSRPLDAFDEWYIFKKKHNKQYGNEEERTRFAIFSDNLKYIEEHNKKYDRGEKSYYLGVNQFTDLKHEEFVMYNGFAATNRTGVKQCSKDLVPEFLAVPSSVNWTDKGYVTPVKNQGQCGSCWSFSTTGSVEGQHFRATGNLLSLSEQQLVDCSGKFGNEGCNGGLMDSAFEYIEAIGGIESEQEYPYEAKQERRCHFHKSEVVATVSGCVDVESGDEDKLKMAVAKVGPVSVAIDASHQSFQMYSGGVYDEPDCSSTQLDHGVLAVGYGTDESQDYWLVKNSWGTTWGVYGYVKMSRNKDNQCGIATQASYPLV